MDNSLLEENDKRYQRIRNEVDEAKDVVVDNIERILNRGENIESLIDDTQELNDSSIKFVGASTNLKRKVQCENLKFYSLLAFGLIIIILIIVLASCGGFKFDKC